MSDDTISFPRPAAWQLSDIAAPQCESAAGQQASPANTRILACMPDVHNATAQGISASVCGSGAGRWPSPSVAAKLLLGVSALLVAVALLPALFRSKSPDAGQTAWQPAPPGPDADMPPLWTGIADTDQNGARPASREATPAAQRAKGTHNTTGSDTSMPGDTGPTEKAPQVSIWPDPHHSPAPPQAGHRGGAATPEQAHPTPRMASLPEPYQQAAPWTASGESTAAGGPATPGQLTGQSNRPTALNTHGLHTRGGTTDPMTGSDTRWPADRPGPSGDVPWYEPWSRTETQPAAQPPHQSRPQSAHPAAPMDWQPQPGQYQPPYPQPAYQPPSYQAPDNRGRQYGSTAQQPEYQSAVRQWEGQPASYQVQSAQAPPPGQHWSTPQPAWSPEGLPPAQRPQYQQQQPEQPQYQWDYTPDYRRPLPAGRPLHGGQLPSMQQQPSDNGTYVPQSVAPRSYTPQSDAPASYPPQSYRSQPAVPQSQAPQSYGPQSYRSQPYGPQSYGPQSYVSAPYDDRSRAQWAQTPQRSTALADRNMPAPPNEPAAGAARYASATVPGGEYQQWRYDSREVYSGGESRLGTSTDSIPARASHERAGPGTY